MLKYSDLPFVSVIIPCYNDEKGLSDTLMSLSRQRYPKKLWEVIVIDNNSTDNTGDIARSFKSIIPKLFILNETIQSSYAARNKGIIESKGSILLFIDSDMNVQKNWITSCVDQLTKLNCVYLGGNVEVFSDRKKINIFEQYDILTGFPIKHYIKKWNFACTCCLIIRRSLIERVGMFDSKLQSGGDFEFGNRVKEYGFNLQYSNQVTYRHPARQSLKSHIQKSIRVAHGVADLKLLYPDRFGQLNAIFLLKSFVPILKNTIKQKNSTVKTDTKILIVLLANFFNYVRAFTLLSRYFKKHAKF